MVKTYRYNDQFKLDLKLVSSILNIFLFFSFSFYLDFSSQFLFLSHSLFLFFFLSLSFLFFFVGRLEHSHQNHGCGEGGSHRLVAISLDGCSRVGDGAAGGVVATVARNRFFLPVRVEHFILFRSFPKE